MLVFLCCAPAVLAVDEAGSSLMQIGYPRESSVDEGFCPEFREGAEAEIVEQWDDEKAAEIFIKYCEGKGLPSKSWCIPLAEDIFEQGYTTDACDALVNLKKLVGKEPTKFCPAFFKEEDAFYASVGILPAEKMFAKYCMETGLSTNACAGASKLLDDGLTEEACERLMQFKAESLDAGAPASAIASNGVEPKSQAIFCPEFFEGVDAEIVGLGHGEEGDRMFEKYCETYGFPPKTCIPLAKDVFEHGITSEACDELVNLKKHVATGIEPFCPQFFAEEDVPYASIGIVPARKTFLKYCKKSVYKESECSKVAIEVFDQGLTQDACDRLLQLKASVDADGAAL